MEVVQRIPLTRALIVGFTFLRHTPTLSVKAGYDRYKLDLVIRTRRIGYLMRFVNDRVHLSWKCSCYKSVQSIPTSKMWKEAPLHVAIMGY